jgi:hypothetical protein
MAVPLPYIIVELIALLVLLEAEDAGLVLSEEERTPKHLKCMAPDLIVVVSGVEFRHYKFILCSSCSFFDNLLSANMREASESRIEFPDKDPKEWLEVYKFLDPNKGSKGATEQHGALTKDNAVMLGPWFDHLGLDDLVRNAIS